jgi:hypothetical protein
LVTGLDLGIGQFGLVAGLLVEVLEQGAHLVELTGYRGAVVGGGCKQAEELGAVLEWGGDVAGEGGGNDADAAGAGFDFSPMFGDFQAAP